MENKKIKRLSDAEMAKLKGKGVGRWVYEDGKWVWKEDTR